MSNIKNIFIHVHDLLIEDETLLRLLHYPPKNLINNTPDPLSDELENILDMELDKLWEIRDEHLPLSSKSDDLIDKAICRIYVYPGRIRSVRNRTAVRREIVVDIFCHHMYEVDFRLMTLSDRVNELLQGARASGLGRIEFNNGYNINAPKGYEAFRMIYRIGDSK